MAISSAEVAEKLRKGFDDLNKIVLLAGMYGSESQRDWKLYADSAEQLYKLERKIQNHKEALEEASRESCRDSFYRRYNAEMSNKQTNVKHLTRYKQFVSTTKELLEEKKQDAESNAASDNDDYHVVAESVNNIDPISKRPIEIPVRNKCCNHVYDKSSIEQLLQANQRTRCPVTGCAATTYVTHANLVVDTQLQAIFARKRLNLG